MSFSNIVSKHLSNTFFDPEGLRKILFVNNNEVLILSQFDTIYLFDIINGNKINEISVSSFFQEHWQFNYGGTEFLYLYKNNTIILVTRHSNKGNDLPGGVEYFMMFMIDKSSFKIISHKTIQFPVYSLSKSQNEKYIYGRNFNSSFVIDDLYEFSSQIVYETKFVQYNIIDDNLNKMILLTNNFISGQQLLVILNMNNFEIELKQVLSENSKIKHILYSNIIQKIFFISEELNSLQIFCVREAKIVSTISLKINSYEIHKLKISNSGKNILIQLRHSILIFNLKNQDFFKEITIPNKDLINPAKDGYITDFLVSEDDLKLFITTSDGYFKSFSIQ